MVAPHPTGRRPLVAELVGPAGAGKSALSACLARRTGVMRASVWNLPRGWWLWNAARSLPTLLALCVRTRPIPWEDMRQLIRLRTLRQVLGRPRAQQAPLMVLDEGPVFALAWLRLFGHQRRRDDVLAPRLQQALQEWAAALDVVVLVNAPDAVLTERIRTRAKPHRVKHQTDAEIGAFLAAYRGALGDVIAALTAQNGVQVVTLDSDDAVIDRTAERLRDLLEGQVHVA
jgi:adenylate kinase family enzyme